MKTRKLCTPMHPLRHVSTVLALMTLLSVSHPALAQEANVDIKVYPGASCQVLDASATLDVRYDERGAIIVGDGGVGHVRVICPVVRDETVGTAGLRQAFVRYVKAAGQTGSITCTLFSRTAFGAEAATPLVETDPGPSGNRILTFGPIRSSDRPRPGAVFTPGYYHFVCDIPVAPSSEVEAFSGIISYRVDEIRTSQAQVKDVSLVEDDED